MPSRDNVRVDGSENPRRPTVSRRRWLEVLGLAGATGLAGCGGDGGDGGDGTATDGPTATDAPTDTEVSGFGAETETTSTEESTGTPEPLPEVGGTYTMSISADITTLNSMYNTEATAGSLINYAIEPSYGFRPGQTQHPEMFELTSDDNQVWVANLRENLQWSDDYGEVTAEDYTYMIQELHQTDWSGTEASTDWYLGGEPIPVEQTGTYEFQIELPSPDPLFPKKPITWEMQVVPKDLIQPYVEEEDAQGLQEEQELLELSYTGNLGPYNLDNWERESSLTYSRSEDYFMRELAADEDSDVPRAYAEAPYFDTLEVQVIPEPSARTGALETGELDELGLTPPQAVNIEGTEGIYLNLAPQPYNTPLFYNQRANGWEQFRKSGVRQALGCAVDKEAYVQGVKRGYAEPEYTWQPEWSPWYTDEVDENVMKFGTGDLYGPEPTRSRMEEALSDTEYEYDGDTLVDGDGEQVELKMMYNATEDVEQSTAEFVSQEFAQNAGIQVNIEGVQPNTFVTEYWRQQEPDNPDELEWSRGVNNYGPRDEVTSAESWDLGRIYGLNTYPMTPAVNETFFLQDGASNAYGYYPSFDAASLFEQANSAENESDLQEVLTELFVKISEDQPMGMLSLGTEITAYQDAVQGPEEEYFNAWNFPAWYTESDGN